MNIKRIIAQYKEEAAVDELIVETVDPPLKKKIEAGQNAADVLLQQVPWQGRDTLNYHSGVKYLDHLGRIHFSEEYDL